MLTYSAVGDWRPLRGIRVLGDDESRAEYLIAIVRAFLATSALLMASFESTAPARYASSAFSLLIAYVVFAALVAMLTRGFAVPSMARTAVFGCDVSFAIVLTSLTNGPASPFFPFLVFIPMSAAYRWGARETLLTSAALVGALFVEAVAVGSSTPLSLSLLDGEFDAGHAVARGLYVVAAGAVLARLAQSEQQRRSEAAAIASIVVRAGTPAGLDGMLESVLGSVLRTFGADRALLAMTHVPTGRVFLWDAAPAAGSGEPVVMSSELEPEQRETYFFEVPGPSWHASRFRSSDWFDLLAFDADGNRLPTHAFTLPASLLAGYRCDSALGISIAFGRQWMGRLLVIDPEIGADRQAALRRAHRFGREIGPAANQEYLLGTLRARAAAAERTLLARALHDGVVQTLIAAQMEVEVVRRSATDAPQFANALSRLEAMLTAETASLRELTHRLKTADSTPRPLAGLTDVVARFERDTGISARFCSEGGLAVSPRSSRELTHILQEGLANVRKHSGARHVLVRAAARDGRLMLSIEDDGRGFPFNGRLSQAELTASHRGPAVIMERVRELGGEITVESKAGQGARVEVAVPL